MSGTLPRRALLAAGMAAGMALPGRPRAQPAPDAAGPLPLLRVLVTAQTLHPIAPLMTQFALAHQHLVREVVLQTQEPVWIAGRFASELRAGRPGADVVLTGTTGLAMGATRQLWQTLPPDLRNAGGPMEGQRTGMMLTLAGEVGLVVSATAGGPLLLHNLRTLPDPPRDAAGLLDYARQNPGRFLYPRPGLSALGLLFVSAVPHLLGDPEPANPQTGWNRSWPYLQELGRHVGYYPVTGAAALEELEEDGCDLMPGFLVSWLRERASGKLSADIGFSLFDDAPLIPLGLFLAVPRGVPPARMPAIQALADFLMQPEIQTLSFGLGLLPGEAGGSTEDDLLTPEEYAAHIRLVPEAMTDRIAARVVAPPLGPEFMAYMLRRWDEQIGATLRQPG